MEGLFNYRHGKVALQLPGRYQIFHISAMHMLDVSVKFLMADKKLSLTIAGEDLLIHKAGSLRIIPTGSKIPPVVTVIPEISRFH